MRHGFQPHSFARKIALVCTIAVLPSCFLHAADPILIEAEAFANTGGWSTDTQFINIMGSSYLLAHGMGRPVTDATTTIQVPATRSYRVWVRTKDWVAHWQAPGTPGRFKVLLGGQPLPADFGTVGANWAWQDGGEIELKAGSLQLALHDLTGFDGRCDAILLHPEPGFRPPDDGHALAEARRQWLGLPAQPQDGGEYDLVVCGGGYSGMAAAISAARQSLRVAFIQDRFVLGGNGSSEVRVWANGGTMRGRYPHIGEIVEEFADHAQDSPGVAEEYGDALKERIIRNEKLISLFLGYSAQTVETDPTSGRILSVTAIDVRTGMPRRFRGRLFVDATGHGSVGALAGAKHTMQEKGRMGMSNMWLWQTEDTVQPWPDTPWALPLELDDFPKTTQSSSQLDDRRFMKGEWFWESGFHKDPIAEAELIRDWNLRAVYGAFTAIKRGPQKDAQANAALKWVAYIGGPRESRLLEGDVVLTREDIVNKRDYKDGCVATTWDIDLHYPKEQYAKKFADNPFISRAEFGAGVDRQNGYPVPYRCFYSKNVPNLFMAGRCISVSHEALGTIRVMRTCGMMGEVVGKAAYLCVKHGTDPRGVYSDHWPEMENLLRQPGAMRRDAMDAPLRHDLSIGTVRAYLGKSTDRPGNTAKATGVDPASLKGLVIDDLLAQMKGEWSYGQNLTPYVGSGYRYASASAKAEARFSFAVPATGKYEVRLAWMPHENRSTRTACTIERPGQPPLTLLLNQREASKPIAGGFHSVGRFEFPAGVTNAIVLQTAGANGFVHVDAVQLLATGE